MNTSGDTKEKKKQSATAKTKATAPESTHSPKHDPKHDKAREMAMLTLETVCLLVLESEMAPPAEDETARTVRQRFINVAAPVSLALMECKGGPRHFHFHYRHKPEDESVLQPVFEDPVDTLALACREASKHCHEELLGLRDPDLRQTRQAFQQAIHAFLAIYDKK